MALLIVVSLWFSQLAADTSLGRDRVIAKSDAGTVTYKMIACTDSVSPEDCHAREQERLARRLREQWISSAVRIYGVSLTPEEEAAVTRNTSAAEAGIRNAAARYELLAAAALRIRRGEDRATVAGELEGKGVTTRELDWLLNQLPTIGAAEATAKKDFAAEGRAALRDSSSRPYILLHLRELVDRRATAKRVPFNVAEEQLWSEVSRTIHTEIVDSAFVFPDRKGILVAP